MRTGQYQQAMNLLGSLANQYPTDWSIQLVCGRVYLIVASLTKNQSLIPVANQYFDRAVNINGFKAGYTTRVVQETMHMMQQRETSSNP
jgi:hypothetical protein